MKILFLRNKYEVTGSRLPCKRKDELILLTGKKVYCRTHGNLLQEAVVLSECWGSPDSSSQVSEKDSVTSC